MSDHHCEDDEISSYPASSLVADSSLASLETLSSKFPGILDYNKLKYMQLRHQFCDFTFSDITWKAMQASGWTYHPGGGGGSSFYRTPGGTRQWSSPNDIQAALDQFAVKPIVNNLQLVQIYPGTVNGDEFELESMTDLRNDICYHIQLLKEERYQESGDNPLTDNVSRKSSNDMEETNSNDEIETDRRRLRTRLSKVVHDSASATTTAVEKGSALYLHKKGRTLISKKKQMAMKNGSNGRASDTSGYTAASFPSLSETVNLLHKFYGSDAQESTAGDKYREEARFAQWRHYLSTNHSLLLYGNGSKYDLLRRFCDVELAKEGYVLELNGFDPVVSIDAILDLFVTLFLDGREPDSRSSNGSTDNPYDPHLSGISESPNQESTSSVDRAIRVAQALCHRCLAATKLSSAYYPIFVAVHSLEGPGLCTDSAQEALAALVAHSVPETSPVAIVRLVASIDHVDAAAALWSTATSSRFSWIWQEMHTNLPYIHELAMLDDEDVTTKKSASNRRRQPQQPSTLQETRVEEILRHLAPRYGEVLQLLAKLQLKELQGTSNPSSWVSFQTFKTACKSNFIIDKDAKLRALLTELTDHKMVISKTEVQSEFVSIPFSVDKVKKIAAYKRVLD